MSKATIGSYCHTYLARLLGGPVPCHELGHSGRVADRITQLNKMLPASMRIVGHWENLETRFGVVRERVYEVRREA